VLVCTECGRENPVDARFCNGCAAPLAASVSVREERKIVTALFVDLVGFTARAERMDPEDVRTLQAPYWGQVRSELERHGGTVEKFIGDAVVALFGAPVAHEDDPERAVRAALSIRDWALEQEDVHLRVAVATGEALVRLGARPLAGEGLASGDVVNTASRLQGVAPADGIVVDERTYRATSQVIDYREVAPVSVKGKTRAVPLWEVVDARSRFGVDVARHDQSPLVGRVRELELIQATLARVLEERAPQLLTIVGVPGIGKSRLLYELMEAIATDPTVIVTWRQGRSLPYGDGVTFWALAEIVKAEAGILETDADDRVRDKLAQGVRRVVEEEPEAGWMERHLHPLLGLGGSEAEVSGDVRGEVFAAWRRYFEALAGSRPLVLAFEDLHWADDGLLDFVDGLVEWVADVPLLVVATARPELLARRQSWGGGKANAATLSLSPLSEPETALLVRELLEQSGVAPEAGRTLVVRAEGNALYAEQYVRMFSERGPTEGLHMPETVHGIIAARLDSLSESEKTLLQNGAVFGKVFWDGAVLALNGFDAHDAARCLHGLDRKEFVQRSRRSSVAGVSEYTFRHVLFRDVAYSQIPRATRGEKHRLAAAWIESLGRPDDHAEMLAHHYVKALDLTRLAGHETGEIESCARVSLRRAGDRALSVNAHEQAAAYFEQALALTPTHDKERSGVLLGYARALVGSGHADALEALEHARSALHESGDLDGAAEVDSILASVWWYRGQQDRVEECLDRAVELVQNRPTSAAKARVLSTAARLRMVAFDFEHAIPLAQLAVVLAETLGLQELHADTLITLGTAKWNSSADPAGVADVEEGLRIALEINALAAAMRGYNNLATFDSAKGHYRSRRRLLEEAVRIGRQLGWRDHTRHIEAQLLWEMLHDGVWDDALRAADEFIAECEAGSPHRSESVARMLRAKVYFARDDAEKARAECERVLAFAREHDAHVFADAVADVMEAYAEGGLLDEARDLAEQILEQDREVARSSLVPLAWVADRIGLERTVLESLLVDFPARWSFWRRVVELALAQRWQEVADIVSETGRRDFEAETRMRAGVALLAAGSPDEAGDQLRQALAFYQSVRATRFIHELERLLADVDMSPPARPGSSSQSLTSTD
jgi:class 3 adenylate cyclase/tetratricopeptide (TPR) repeat protein